MAEIGGEKATLCDYWALATLQPFGEPTAVEHLERQSFFCYSPKFLELKAIRGRRVEVTSQLFPGYLFVKLNEGWRSIFGTRGVASMMMEGEPGTPYRRPMRIRDGEIDRIKSSEVNGVVILEPRLRAQRKFSPGDLVAVKAGGAMEYRVGVFVGASVADRVKVLFDMLGRKVPVSIREGDLVAA